MKKIIRLTESDLVRLVKRVIQEQGDVAPQGYKDITEWYSSPEGVFYIPDGEYLMDGFGYQGVIKTRDGKDTGYMITLKNGIKGALPSRVSISKNGGAIAYSLGIDKFYLNDTILNSSGLRKK
jgi:hypothetical protein